jgi:hypothetical protein
VIPADIACSDNASEVGVWQVEGHPLVHPIAEAEVSCSIVQPEPVFGRLERPLLPNLKLERAG